MERKFNLETIEHEGQTLIKTSSIHSNFETSDTISSLFHGGKKGTKNEKYGAIEKLMRQRGKIKGAFYFTKLELFAFLKVYEPRENKKLYKEFKEWVEKELLFKSETGVKEKEVVKTQTWSFELVHYSDGTNQLFRNNKGFNAIELLGLAASAQMDIMDQMRGVLSVDNVITSVELEPNK